MYAAVCLKSSEMRKSRSLQVICRNSLLNEKASGPRSTGLVRTLPVDFLACSKCFRWSS